MVLLLVSVAPSKMVQHQGRKVKRGGLDKVPLAAIRRRHHATVIGEAAAAYNGGNDFIASATRGAT